MFKKKKLHGNFVITFLNTSDISFTSSASKGVNDVLQTPPRILGKLEITVRVDMDQWITQSVLKMKMTTTMMVQNKPIVTILIWTLHRMMIMMSILIR